ncbi:MAG: prepilin-type N-terminal cleavage/methylation domain-containing protein [Acidimicrobiales bacterium]
MLRDRPTPYVTGEEGFTLIEMMIAASVLVVAAGIFGSSLISLTKTSNLGEALVANEQTTNIALTQFGHDLRSAATLTTLGTTNAYSTQIIMVEVSSSGGAGPTIEWTFDPNAETLSREVLVNGSATSSQVEVSKVLNSSSQPVFTYFSSSNTDMVASGSTPATVSLCTTRVEVHLISASDTGPTPFQETQDVQVRNQLADLAAQGNNPC